MLSYVKQSLATFVLAYISVEQVLSGGNLLLATVAALLAILAGRWALRKQKLQAETAELDKQIAELKLQRELDRLPENPADARSFQGKSRVPSAEQRGTRPPA